MGAHILSMFFPPLGIEGNNTQGGVGHGVGRRKRMQKKRGKRMEMKEEKEKCWNWWVTKKNGIFPRG